MPVGIVHIEPSSPATAAGLRRGDKIHRVNAQDVTDALDFHFFSAEDRLDLQIERSGDGTPADASASAAPAATQQLIFIEREFPGQPLGIEVEELVVRHCRCNCVFCFVHQNPKGLRDTLYIKDEDYRYSFLYGNYVTGTNLSDWDIDRIIRMKLSPLYFSVHATNDDLRLRLLGIKRARPIMPLLRYLTENGIEIHTQIVLCPGLNDGDELIHTTRDLIKLFPMMGTIAVVPLGLTQHRDKLPKLEPFISEYGRRLIEWAKPLQADAEAKCGQPVLFLSDEVYLISGVPVPDYDAMDESPQLDNGVGMIANWYRDFEETMRGVPAAVPQPFRVAAFTTQLSAEILRRGCAALNRVSGLEVVPIPLVNSLWGETIHVTGLLPGRDFQRGIEENPDFDLYLIPGNAVRRWDRLFLDDVTLDDLEALTTKPVRVIRGGFDEFTDAIFDVTGALV